MTHRLGFAAALAVVLVLFAIGACLLVERWGNAKRERERERLIEEARERRAKAFAALVVGHHANVVEVEFPLRGGKP